MKLIQMLQTILFVTILGYQWLINRSTLQITEALRKRIEALEAGGMGYKAYREKYRNRPEGEQ